MCCIRSFTCSRSYIRRVPAQHQACSASPLHRFPLQLCTHDVVTMPRRPALKKRADNSMAPCVSLFYSLLHLVKAAATDKYRHRAPSPRSARHLRPLRISNLLHRSLRRLERGVRRTTRTKQVLSHRRKGLPGSGPHQRLTKVIIRADT